MYCSYTGCDFQEEYDFEAFENINTQVEIVTTTTETRSGPDGIIEIVDEERMIEQGTVNGVALEQQQHQSQQQLMVEPQQPVLFDMDLERMHVDLYKGKYLTPQDFLDDVEKIVHNAEVRMDEDPDRLFKAQAMLTAAQVSIHDFDHGLRLECDRMAVRERQRREEHKKSREKGKGKADDPVHVVGTRRSARHNGQQPELSITDPLKLERQLKRQRSNDATGDSHGSSEENGDGRSAKRSKVSPSDDDDDDRDPLDIVGPDSSQPRPTTVRFVSNTHPLPTQAMASPMDIHDHQSEFPQSPSPRKNGGFDPFLLNPAPPTESTFIDASPLPLPSLMNGITFSAPSTVATPVDPCQPFGNQSLHALHVPLPHTLVNAQGSLPIVESIEQQPEPQQMSIERTPTPLPEFHVDNSLLYNLKSTLRNTTGSLTVEQLEQLRATCLSCIWRHRSEWDRDALVRELKDTVQEFVEEVAEDMSDVST